MKKTLQGLLVAALCVGALHAKEHSNKTFLRPRPVLRNMAMRKTTWHKQTHEEGDSKFGGSIQVTGFYQSSGDKSGLGRYFGAHATDCSCQPCDCKNACTSCSGSGCSSCCPTRSITRQGCCPTDSKSDCCPTACKGCALGVIEVDNTKLNDSTPAPRDLASFDIVQNPSAAVGAAAPANSDAVKTQFFQTNPSGTIQLRPEINTWGFRLDYYQDLDKLWNGLHFRISTAVANVETCLKPRLCGTSVGFKKTELTSLPDVTMQIPNVPLSGTQPSTTVTAATFDFGSNNGKTILDYFSGNFSQSKNPLTSFAEGGSPTTVDQALVQDALCKLRIPCGCCDDTTELADIEFVLGYNIIHRADRHVGINFGFVIPTGNSAKSRILFEPISGNGDHWAVGAGFDTAFQLYKSDGFALDLLVALDYRFLFEDSERRVVGVRGSDGQVLNHAWYRLFGQVGASKVFPGANVLCCKVDVEPGSQVDMIAALAFNWKNWTFDLGYNLFYQDKEDVCLDKCCWTDNRYGFIDDNYDPSVIDNTTPARTDGNVFANADGTVDAFEPVAGVNNSPINRVHLCPNAASTPSQLTHKLYGGVGYAFNNWNYPFLIGFGSGYEWADDNAGIDQWSIWGKLGVSF